MANKTVKCPWCGRRVDILPNGRVKPHIQSTKVKCVGSGQQGINLAILLRENRKAEL